MMAKKKQESEEEEILTSVEARLKYKAENYEEPDHPAGRYQAVAQAKSVAAPLQVPAESPKETKSK